jgi:hypothetical protein
LAESAVANATSKLEACAAMALTCDGDEDGGGRVMVMTVVAAVVEVVVVEEEEEVATAVMPVRAAEMAAAA